MEDGKPKRRVRYSGKYPKNFKEKYKEQNPELYSADVEKIRKQGKTPAGMHISICVNEILEILKIKPGQIGLDATLGYGGHTLEILKQLKHTGKLIALDVDPIELPKTKERLEKSGYTSEYLEIRKMNFSGIDQIAAEFGELDFVLADLGVSSMQIDDPERGFSFKVDGPLDLRLNPRSGKSAAQLLKQMKQDHLEEILKENADEEYAEEIAETIFDHLSKKKPLETTMQLQNVIAEALNFIPQNVRKDLVKKSCQRCFQALRIEVNDEFGALNKFLEKLPEVLKSGGKVAILSFHSGEDRRVKKAFKYFFNEGIFSEIAPDPIVASAQECFNNSRAKSAKLRWAVKA
jgi:16S rRNA (cytosine1402-N4)-methyltransferase